MLKIKSILRDPVILILFVLVTALACIILSFHHNMVREKRQNIIRACIKHKVYKEKWTASESKKYCEIMN